MGLIRGKLTDLTTFVSTAAEKGTAAHEVEGGLFRSLLELGKTQFRLFMLSVGNGDIDESVTPDDGRTLHRNESLHRRKLQAMFGKFFLNPQACSEQSRAAIELVPTDQRLQLPESDVSCVLQEWDKKFSVEMAFGKARKRIELDELLLCLSSGNSKPSSKKRRRNPTIMHQQHSQMAPISPRQGVRLI